MKLILAVLALVAIIIGTSKMEFLPTDISHTLDIRSEDTAASQIDSIDSWLQKLHADQLFNGGILMAREGKPLFMKTYGFVDANQSVQLNNKSSFRLASVSKQFTAAAIMLLASQGKLKFDDLVSQYIPDFPYSDVTIRHLLTMTSGIPDAYMSLAEEKKSIVGDTLTISEAVKLIIDHPGKAEKPLTEYHYNNSNYILLAGILEKVSGDSFEMFMLSNFFEPLKMRNTRVWNLMSDDMTFENKTESIEFEGSKTVKVHPTWLDGVSGDGGVFSSLEDFLIWDEFWNGNDIIESVTMKEALQPVTLLDGSISHYGFGWDVSGNNEMKHTGSWLSARTFIYRNQETKECLVLLDNSASTHIDDIAKALLPVVSKLKKMNLKASLILGLRTTIYRVPDLNQAKEWYAKAFQTDPYFDEPFYVGFNIGGYELGLQPEESPITSRSINVESYWGVEEIEKTVAHLVAIGATIHEPVTNVGDGILTAQLKDPWDNLIGLIVNPYFKLPEE